MLDMEVEENGRPPSVGKRQVEIHVTFLKIGEISTLKEMYEADVMIKTKWREPALDALKDNELTDIDWEDYWDPKIIIDNARPDVKETFSRHVVRDDGETFVRERRRYRGTFSEQLELWDFPFDVQDLSLNVMSDHPSAEVELVESTDIHRIYRQSFIDEQEYYLYKYVGSQKKEFCKERVDPSVRRSTIYARCAASRRAKYFIYNLFMVIFIIAFLSFVIYAVRPEKVENRLQLGFTLLLTSVAFKFAATQSLPRISYLTYLDRYSIATMTVVFLNTIWFGVMVFIPLRADGRSLPDFIALGVMFAFYFSYNIYFLLRILMIPIKRRREMKRREMIYISKLRQRAKERQREDSSSDSEDDVVTIKKGKKKKTLRHSLHKV